MSRPRRSVAIAVATVLATPLLSALGAGAAPATAATLSTWSVSPRMFFQDPSYASSNAVAHGRVWELSLERPTRPVLRWRRLSDGRKGAVAVKIPRPRGSVLLSESSGGTDTQLMIAGNRGFVVGDWCIEEEEDYDGCARSRGFDVQFDVRTGRVLRSSQPKTAPHLVGGTRVSYVDESAEPMVLRDAINRRRVFRFPKNARDVQGAGRYISWKDPDDYERRYGGSGPGSVGTDWSAIHVRERTSGRVVYDLRMGALTRVIQDRRTLVQIADLQPDGSLALSVDVDSDAKRRRFYPVVVDGHGHVHRAAQHPMRRPNQFSSQVRGARVLLDVETNGNGTCGPEAGWLTAIGGRRGNALRRLPHSRGYTIAHTPWFLTSSTMRWYEGPTDPRAPEERYRVRVGHDLRSLPLTYRDRPRC